MDINTRYGHGKLGNDMFFTNDEMNLLKDETTDLVDFFKDHNLFGDNIEELFSEENAKYFVKHINIDEMKEFFDNLRNVYYILNEITQEVTPSRTTYKAFFNIKEKKEGNDE